MHAHCLNSACPHPPTSTIGGKGFGRSSSTGSLAALAAASQQQQHILQHHAAVSRLRSNMPRAASHASLCQASGAPNRMDGAQAGMSEVREAANQHHAALKAGPFASASLTRVFISVGQRTLPNLAGRKFRAAGPVSLLLFLFGMVLAIVAAVRSVLVRRVRSCKCCMGYGITRCRLCNGDGTVEWAGKNNHQEMCPLCMTKRYVTCQDCGGFYHRPLFNHVMPTGRNPVPEFLGAA